MLQGLTFISLGRAVSAGTCALAQVAGELPKNGDSVNICTCIPRRLSGSNPACDEGLLILAHWSSSLFRLNMGQMLCLRLIKQIPQTCDKRRQAIIGGFE